MPFQLIIVFNRLGMILNTTGLQDWCLYPAKYKFDAR